MPRLPYPTRMAIVGHYQQYQDMAAIKRDFGININVIKRWIERFEATGDCLDRRRSGRPRIINSVGEDEAMKLLTSHDSKTTTEVSNMLYNQGLTTGRPSPKTVGRAARRGAAKLGLKLRVYRGKPRKRLTDDTRAKRVRFCKANLHTSWKHVMITDRKKFSFFYPGARVSHCQWGVEGKEREAYQVNHARVINVYLGLTAYGVTSLHLVTGTSGMKTNFKNKKDDPARNITSSEYKEVLNKTLLPKGQSIFSSNSLSRWVLQQDNDPTHNVAASVIGKWNEENVLKVKLLPEWPPNSPDLSPIENLWAILDKRLARKGCERFQDFSDALKEEVEKMNSVKGRRECSRLMGSLPKRMRLCLERQGGKTGY